ncbi:MAG: amino acid synthesis family protein [Betaproteobacteria bacterium]
MTDITATNVMQQVHGIAHLPPVEVRKICTFVEQTFHDGGPHAAIPHRKATIAAVIRNPYAGHYFETIEPFMDALNPLGLELARKLVDALGGDPKRIEAYGKGTIVGLAGELEHGAFWHVPGGYAMREVLGGAKAIVPSTTKLGPAGTALDIPVHHINAAYVRSHFDAVEVRVQDAPKPDELVLILAMADGPRIHARMGGLKASEISIGDGQR